MVSVGTRLGTVAPIGYQTPAFPGLYWPIRALPGEPQYLYYSTDIWRFTVFWTLIIYTGFYLSTGCYAFMMQPKKLSKVSLSIPIVFILVGGLEAVLSGSIVGLILAAVYNAGYFKMSTFVPLVWAIINVLILVLSSFSNDFSSDKKRRSKREN